MKKIDRLIAIVLLLYLGIAAGTIYQIKRVQSEESSAYKVEVNRLSALCQSIEPAEFNWNEIAEKIDTSTCAYVKQVDFLAPFCSSPAKGQSKEQVMEFYQPVNGMGYQLMPLYSGEILQGYVKFSYLLGDERKQLQSVRFCLIGLAFIGVFLLLLLLYLRQNVLKPFHEISTLPYELAKGNLEHSLKENKNRYFGKFIWGISLLQDHLSKSRRKELKLEKEKKLMVLSISHDIKTPLNAIMLYVKALKEGLYETEEKKQEAIGQIGQKAEEIEGFVKEIVKTSSEDILDIEVKKEEFYLQELLKRVEGTYKKRFEMMHLLFEIEVVENRLIKGDFDRTFEAIGNIIENACKYGDGREIRMYFTQEEYCQLIHIYNSGKAVSAQDFNHLFDSFYRGSNTEGKEGNGLGLYICQQIMHKMEGDIYAEAREAGMDFVLVLPLA